ncbi:MAG: hypothetical protein HYR85_05525 [Planctomycetes bacterium]|nr:hypothetical protein [Planctomycetota bacterium]MBI3848260.1 hypothetical protein [Planctomycetota bacterium]
MTLELRATRFLVGAPARWYNGSVFQPRTSLSADRSAAVDGLWRMAAAAAIARTDDGIGVKRRVFLEAGFHGYSTFDGTDDGSEAPRVLGVSRGTLEFSTTCLGGQDDEE